MGLQLSLVNGAKLSKILADFIIMKELFEKLIINVSEFQNALPLLNNFNEVLEKKFIISKAMENNRPCMIIINYQSQTNWTVTDHFRSIPSFEYWPIFKN